MQTLTLSIDGMTCGHCVRSVRSALESLPAVEVHDVQVGSARVALGPSVDADDVLAAVHGAGFEATIADPGTESTEPVAGDGCACCAPAPTALSRSSGVSRH